jgi:uncharacterized protein YlxW (UPF0749 family)
VDQPPIVDRSQAPDPGAGSPDVPIDPDDYHESSLWRWRGPASLIGGAMFAVLGWLLIAGVLAYGGDDALANARPSDLVQILDSLETENDRLDQEARRLQAEIDTLQSGTSQQALAQAQERLESLQILAGTTAVRGPGVRIVIRDPDGGIDATDILDAVQELRDAGAESIEVAQRRVVVDTWFADPAEGEGPGVLISGELRSSPYTILAIGDPQTLATAMEIPGGVADSARTAGAEIVIERRDSLDITSTVPLSTPEYAEPVQPQ